MEYNTIKCGVPCLPQLKLPEIAAKILILTCLVVAIKYYDF
jgi:hypothetical protein